MLMGAIWRRKSGLGHTSSQRREGLRFEPLESRVLLSATPTDDSFRLAIYADSAAVGIPAEVGVRADDSTESLFTVDHSGEIYFAQNAPKLGDFFDIWRENAGEAGNNPDAHLSEDQLLSHTEDGTNTVQMFVNGQVSTEFEDYVVQDDDQVVLVYGDNPVLSLNTNYGPIVVELFEDATPITVNNFLNYVNDGDYLESFFHRSVEDFVIQGGGFTTDSTTFTDTDQFTDVLPDAEIQNEPGISNLRGTFAMAKLGGNPNSATSQFFVNLTDNHATSGANLDTQNGGFTVFGQILDMTTADTIADLTITPAADIDTTISSNDAILYSSLPLGVNYELAVIQGIAGQGELSGRRYLDGNKNGVYDTGEETQVGATVYLDANENGILDAGEQSTVTAADGSYRFQVEAGQYVVRPEVSEGSPHKGPFSPESYVVDVEIGREASNLDFGELEESDLGPVDFLLIPQIDLTESSQSYTLQATHDGYLTFEALSTGVSDSVAMTLCDGDGDELTS
jgi:cyclophilin family peptidyl-prolyl cis-trans isomerase